jgi:hypothetical protein
LALRAFFRIIAAMHTFYVSPTGNDAWSGTRASANRARNDGPFATLARGQRAVRAAKREAGDQPQDITIVLRGGVYAQQRMLVFDARDGGTPARFNYRNEQTHAATRVTYRAYPGETPVISGGERINGWEHCEVNGRAALRAQLDAVKRGRWNFTQLWVNGKRARRPRWPKQGLLRIKQLLGKVVWTGYVLDVLFTGQDTFRFAPGDLKPWRNLTDVEMVALHFWNESRIPFKRVDAKTRTAQLQWRSRMRLSDDFGRTPAPYYVDNVFEALEDPGQFYLDRPNGLLYYLPRAGETLETLEAYAPRLPQIMQVRGTPGKPVTQLHFDGIAFEHNEWVAGDEKFSATPQAACHIPGALVLRHAHDVTFGNCAVRHTGSYGVEITDESRHVTLSRCEITDLGGGGVKVWHGFTQPKTVMPGSGPDMNANTSCRHITISDCEISDGGIQNHQAVGVLVGLCSNVQVLHNHIHDFDYSGVSVGWNWGYDDTQAFGNAIEYNHIHHIGRGMLSDMGGIYTLGVQPGTRLRHNVIHDVDSRGYGGWGIYNDEGSSNMLIENNLVYRTKSNPYNQHYGRDNIVRNNIFALGRMAQVSRARLETHTSFVFERNIVYYDTDADILDGNWRELNAVIDHNLYFNASGVAPRFMCLSWHDWRARGADVHGVIADPLFVDPANGDFRLKKGSPAADVGFVAFDPALAGPRK